MGRKNRVTFTRGQEHSKALFELIKQAAERHELWRIWDDLMFFGSTAFAQSAKWCQERENEYDRRFNRYSKEEQTMFHAMFAEIIMALEQEGCVDILGSLYMKLELNNHWKGQYFTPNTVCLGMAQMLFVGCAETLEKKDFITVNDPCCGAGALLIAFAHTCLMNKINYQQRVLFVGQDLDSVVARMCFIQMSLLGMPGYVIIGDSLRYPPLQGMEHPECQYLYTPFFKLNGFKLSDKITAPLNLQSTLAAEVAAQA